MEAGEPGPLARLPRAEKFLLPLQRFADHAAVGVVNLTTDKSGTPRGAPMLFRTSDKVELSFPLRVAALATGSEPVIQADSLTLAGRRIRTDIDHVLPIAFYGRHGTIRTISAASVLDGTVAPEARSKPHRRDRGDRHRRRRRLSHAVRSGHAGRRDHCHGHFST